MNTLRKLLLSLGLLIVGGLPASAFDNWVACANGNFDTAATWCKVDAAVYTNSEAANTALTTSFQASTAAQPGALTVQAIAVKIASRAASPVGTMTCDLFNSTGSVEIDVVTVAVSDIPTAAAASNEGGWFIMQLPSSHLLIAATNYQVRCLTSNASQVNLYSVSGTNWAQMMVTTTTGSPATGDNMVVGAWWTAAATNTAFTVTMNHNSATGLGTGTVAIAPLTVSDPVIALVKGGTLAYSTGAATQLKLNGNLVAYNGGTLNVGKNGTPITTGNTALLQFVGSTDGDYGLICRNGGNCTTNGVERTAGVLVVKTLLAANASVGATSLTTVDSTGWLNGDLTGIASTIRPGAVQSETKALTADAVTTALTVAAVTSAHSGTATPTGVGQAEVILLTRNVQISNGSAVTVGIVTYVYCAATATCDFEWTEFFNIGATLAGRRGIVNDTTTGNFKLLYSSWHDTKNYGVYLGESQATWGNTTVQHSVAYNVNTANTAGQGGLSTNTAITSSANNLWTIDDVTIMKCGSDCFNLLSLAGQFTNITAVDGGATGNGGIVSRGGGIESVTNGACGTWGPLTSHSNQLYTVYLTKQGMNCTFSGLTEWFSGGGLEIGGIAEIITVDPYTSYGNALINFSVNTGGCYVTLRNGTMASISGSTTGSNIAWDVSNCYVVLDNMTLSPTSGVWIPTTNDFNPFQVPSSPYIIARNSTFGAATLLANQNTMNFLGYIAFERFNGTAGSHKTLMYSGTVSTDTSIFHTVSPSMRMTPIGPNIGATNNKLPSAPNGSFKGVLVPVANGVAATIRVYVCRWVTTGSQTGNDCEGQASAYNGAAPRLIQRANPTLGQNSDVLCATSIVTNGTWELLTCSTSTPTDDGDFEFIVDVAGTVGSVNISDWGCVGCSSPSGSQKNWFNGLGFPAQPAGGGSNGRIIGGFLLKRDLNHPANDNSLMWLNKVA